MRTATNGANRLRATGGGRGGGTGRAGGGLVRGQRVNRVNMQGLDTRLIAAVQRRAGASSHQAAGLLQAYYYGVTLYRRLSAGPDAAAADEARRQVLAAKVRLRQFLVPGVV
jgi:hypothetical protein